MQLSCRCGEQAGGAPCGPRGVAGPCPKAAAVAAAGWGGWSPKAQPPPSPALVGQRVPGPLPAKCQPGAGWTARQSKASSFSGADVFALLFLPTVSPTLPRWIWRWPGPCRSCRIAGLWQELLPLLPGAAGQVRTAGVPMSALILPFALRAVAVCPPRVAFTVPRCVASKCSVWRIRNVKRFCFVRCLFCTCGNRRNFCLSLSVGRARHIGGSGHAGPPSRSGETPCDRGEGPCSVLRRACRGFARVCTFVHQGSWPFFPYAVPTWLWYQGSDVPQVTATSTPGEVAPAGRLRWKAALPPPALLGGSGTCSE